MKFAGEKVQRITEGRLSDAERRAGTGEAGDAVNQGGGGRRRVRGEDRLGVEREGGEKVSE